MRVRRSCVRVASAASAPHCGWRYTMPEGKDTTLSSSLPGTGRTIPSRYLRFSRRSLKKGTDYVQGSRYLPGGVAGEMPLHRRIGTHLYPLIIRIMTRYHATDATNGFRAYRTSIFNDPRIDINQHWLDTYEMEYLSHCKVISLGYKVKEVPVSKLYPQHVSYRHYTKARPLRRLVAHASPGRIPDVSAPVAAWRAFRMEQIHRARAMNAGHASSNGTVSSSCSSSHS